MKTLKERIELRKLSTAFGPSTQFPTQIPSTKPSRPRSCTSSGIRVKQPYQSCPATSLYISWSITKPWRGPSLIPAQQTQKSLIHLQTNARTALSNEIYKLPQEFLQCIPCLPNCLNQRRDGHNNSPNKLHIIKFFPTAMYVGYCYRAQHQ